MSRLTAMRMLTSVLALGVLAMADACVLTGDEIGSERENTRAGQSQPAGVIRTEARTTTASTETTSTTTRTVETEETPVPGSTLIGGMRGPTGVLKPVRTVPNKMGMIIM